MMINHRVSMDNIEDGQVTRRKEKRNGSTAKRVKILLDNKTKSMRISTHRNNRLQHAIAHFIRLLPR